MSNEITIIENTTGEVTITDLGELADSIHIKVEAANHHLKYSARFAIEAGQLLIEAKSLVQHGQWEQWLTDNCQVAPRTAQAYMRLAKHIPELPDAKAQRVADLPLREAIKAITTDPTEPPRQHGVKQIANRDERERVAKVCRTAASGANEAARLIANHTEIKPAKVQSLRNKLAAVLAELDKLTEPAPS